MATPDIIVTLENTSTIAFLGNAAASAGTKHWKNLPRVGSMSRARVTLQRAHSPNVYLDRGKLGRFISFLAIWYEADYDDALGSMVADIDALAQSNSKIKIYDQPDYEECEYLGEGIEGLEPLLIREGSIFGLAAPLQFRSYK